MKIKLYSRRGWGVLSTL